MREIGLDTGEISRALDEMRRHDANWRHPLTWSLVYSAGDSHDTVIKAAYEEFFHENGLSPSAFPSLERMEREVVRALLHHVGANVDSSGGTMTSGGTESILLAVKAYRDQARVRKPNLIVPNTAHPAFAKAGALLGVEVRHVPIGPVLTADVEAMSARIDGQTILIGASAPAYPYGLVDPITELSEIASAHGIGLHVDACLGGMVLPVLRNAGRQVPSFDFGIPGVTSMSVDLHKYGFAAKGASAILYRDRDLRRHQFTVIADWPGGALTSPTLLGTRPGGAIAAAWVALNHLGLNGYTRLFLGMMDTVDAITAGLTRIGDVTVLGNPPMSVFAVTSSEKDVFSIADGLERRGWRIDRQTSPDCIHHIVTPRHSEVVDRYLTDFEDAYAHAPPPPTNASPRIGFYGVTARVDATDDLETALLDDLGRRYDHSSDPDDDGGFG